MDLPNRDDHEAELLAMLENVFAPWAAALIRGGAINWDRFREQLEQALRDKLAAMFLLIVLVWQDSTGLNDPRENAVRAAVDWAVARSQQLSRALVDSVRQGWLELRQRVTGQLALPPDEVRALLDQARARLIAVTEITRAHNAGLRYIARRFADITGQELAPFWVTERDEKVCPICRPLHLQGPDVWRDKFPLGPPAHPNCRCWLSWLAGEKNRLQFPRAAA